MHEALARLDRIAEAMWRAHTKVQFPNYDGKWEHVSASAKIAWRAAAKAAMAEIEEPAAAE